MALKCTCGTCGTCKARERYRRIRRAAEAGDPEARAKVEQQRAVDRARYYRHREKRIAAARRYHEAHPEEVADHKRRWVERNPEKRRAHNVLNAALRDGKIQRGPCEREDEGTCNGKVHAHHDDYSKPLEVRWLCAAHHGETRRT